MEKYKIDFWKEKHKTSNGHALSNYNLKKIKLYHKLEISPKQVITNIGVGTGELERELREDGHEVQSIDVSEAAFEKVKGVSSCFLSPDADKALPADFIICNLVVQHNTLEDLKDLFLKLQLKEAGIFSVQVANFSTDSSVLKGDDVGFYKNGMLHMYHEKDFAEFLVNDCNFEITEQSTNFVFKVEGIYWVVFQCTRKHIK